MRKHLLYILVILGLAFASALATMPFETPALADCVNGHC
jgi:hypothetical protein